MNITETLGLVRKAIQISNTLENLDIRDALIAAREALSDQREENLELRDANHALDEKISELTLALKNKSSLRQAVDCYEKKDESGKLWAICAKCYESEGSIISLVKVHSAAPTCPKCKNYFTNVERNKYENFNRNRGE